jgi:uncharacterized membrane protein YjgN (DUF898 family)
MKHQYLKNKKIVLKSLIIFLIGIILLLARIWRNQNSGVSYNELYFQYYVNNGGPVILLGIGFVIGAFLQIRNLGKERSTHVKKKKHKNKRLGR